MVLGKRSLTVTMILACAILTGFAASGHCQKSADSPQNTGVQPKPGDQKLPPSLRQMRAGLEVVADLSIDPPAYTGSCPAEFALKGRIASNKPITIYYRFTGANMPPSLAKPLTFEKAGTKEVTETRSLGNTSTPALRATAVLQVVWPGKADSNVLDVILTCTNAVQPGATGSPGSVKSKSFPMPGPGMPGQQTPAGAFPLPQIGPGVPGPGSPAQPTDGAFPLPQIGPEGLQPGEQGPPMPGSREPQGPSVPMPPIGPDIKQVK
jgi:hypothetical protein